MTEGERGISRSTWAWLALGSAALALSLWVFFRLQDTDASHEQALLNTEFDAYVNRARLAVDERAAASVLLFHPICGTGTNDTGQCGLILAVIRIPDLKTSLFPELDPTLGNLQVSDITDTRERIGIYPRFERHAPRLERVAGLHHFSDIIDVAGRRWEISVGLEAPPRSSEATVLLLLGCLISIWIFSTGLLQGRRTREVERRVGEALQRLRESETQYSQLLESVVEGIFGMDRNGNAPSSTRRPPVCSDTKSMN